MMRLAGRLRVGTTAGPTVAAMLGLGLLGLHGGAAPASAQQAVGYPAPTMPVAQSAEFAAVRARFEGMSEAQVRAAGYVVAPNCVTAPAAANAGLPTPRGNMGFHAEKNADWAAQFKSGRWDPQTPPILLLDASKRVVGIEWEAVRTTQPAPSLFGQTAPLLPGHGGAPEVNDPHYMLHAYFKPNGMVLFDVFDPELRCPVAQVTGPAAPVAAAPAQVPAGLPRAGGAVPALAGLLGLSLLAAGVAARRVRR